MKADVKVRFICLLIVGVAAVEFSVHAIKPDRYGNTHDQRLKLYTGVPPGEASRDYDMLPMQISDTGRYSSVHQPVLDIYHAKGENPSGAAVVICPGGGYGVLTYDHEGIQVAQWLSKNGITGIILRYRMKPYRHPVPMMDVQRAIQMVRANATQWSIDPDRIGVMGFSAGGHLASTASVHYLDAKMHADDPLLRHSSRPNFSVLVYPVITLRPPYADMRSSEHLLGRNPSEKLLDQMCTHQQVNPRTPPTLLVHSLDDKRVPIENSKLYLEALEKHKVPSSLLTYKTGGHGFGLGRSPDHETAAWPSKCLKWFAEIGVLETDSRSAER